MLKIYLYKPLFRSLIAFLAIAGGGLCDDYTASGIIGKEEGEEDAFDNYTIEINGAVLEYRNIDVKTQLKITGNLQLYGKMTLSNGANLVISTSGATSGFQIKSNGILDLSAITDVSEFKFGDNNKFSCFGTIILPTNITNGSVSCAINFFGDCFLKYYLEPKITVTNGFIQIGASNSGYDFAKFNCVSGTSTQPTKSAITRKVFYKDLTNYQEANTSDNTLDLNSLSDEVFDDVIREDSGDINFTLLTTPSKGITIADGVSVTKPINIRLKLCGE